MANTFDFTTSTVGYCEAVSEVLDVADNFATEGSILIDVEYVIDTIDPSEMDADEERLLLMCKQAESQGINSLILY